MSRKNPNKRRRHLPNRSNASLTWLMLTFILAVLINAGLMTSASYMLMLRTGVLRPLMRGTLWPMLLVILCILFAVVLTTGGEGKAMILFAALCIVAVVAAKVVFPKEITHEIQEELGEMRDHSHKKGGETKDE